MRPPDGRPFKHHVDTKTGEIFDTEEELWAAQNRRIDGLSLINNAIRLLELPTKRRTVIRRRITHTLCGLWPCLLMFVAIIVLAYWLHQPPPHCEPNLNC